MKRINLTILLFWAFTAFGQYQVNISGTITEGPTGFPVPEHPVFFTIVMSNDTSNIITDNVITNDSGFYSYAFPMTGSFARVDIVTPDCNGTVLSSTIYIDSTTTSIVQDFTLCSLSICQAFFIYEQTGDYSFQFTDQSTGQGLNYLWDFGDNASSVEQDPLHTYNAPGTYDVCLFISSSDSTCFDVYCTQVVAGSGAGCLAQFTYYPEPQPAGYVFQFIDLSSGNITAWSWSFGDSTFSQEQNPLHVFPEQGQYEVCLSISGPDCQSTWCEYVTVTATGDCYNFFTYQAVETTVDFQGLHYPETPSFYAWDFGDGTTGEGQAISHEYAETGIFYVTLNTSDSNGCFATSSQSIVVGDTIIFNQVYGQVFEGNLPLMNGYVMISSIQNNPGFTPYSEVMPVDSSGIYLFPYVPNGEFVVYAVPEDGNGYIPTYFGDVLHWNEAPFINSTETGVLMNIVLSPARSVPTYGNGSINGFITGLNWQNGLESMMNVLLFNENYESVTFSRVQQDGSFVFDGLAVGTYYLYPELPGVLSSYFQVVVTDIIFNTTVYLNYNGTSVLGEEENVLAEDDVRVYPNPASDHATLSVSCRQPGELTLQIIDLTGRKCFSGNYQVNPGQSTIDIPVEDFEHGIYVLKISDSSGNLTTVKFIKQ